MEHNAANEDVLRGLIQVNEERAKGYENAIEGLREEDDDLVVVFSMKAAQSETCKMELQEASETTEEPPAPYAGYGRIYQAWKDTNAIFAGHDRYTVLNNCELAEDAVQEIYEMALQTEGISANVRSLIEIQKNVLKASHKEIRALRDQTKY